jgi:uncharacterized repeat protein (TIGR03847 family)
MSVDDFEAADALAVGAFGAPGQRLFLLQARRGTRVLTMKIEKGQAVQLAAHLGEVMADRAALPADSKPALLTDDAEPAWVVGSMRVGYDQAAEQVELVLEEFVREDDDDAAPASARVTITADQAASLAAAVEMLVAAGRPPCPLCGYPLDPSGHVCPKSNGHRPPTL